MGRFLSFSPHRGDTVRSCLTNFTLISSRVWVYGPKNWNFTNIIVPKGRVPCTILTKFTGFIRVLSLHNFAKFGCFSSISDKIINNLPRWEHFQPNFRRPLAANLLIGPKNVWGWNDGTDNLYHHAKFGGNRTTHVGVRVQSVMFFTFFVYNAPQITIADDFVALLRHEIASVFVGWFRCSLQLFREEKPFPVKSTDLKIVTR